MGKKKNKAEKKALTKKMKSLQEEMTTRHADELAVYDKGLVNSFVAHCFLECNTVV